jgi:hypothetical protein
MCKSCPAFPQAGNLDYQPSANPANMGFLILPVRESVPTISAFNNVIRETINPGLEFRKIAIVWHLSQPFFCVGLIVLAFTSIVKF